MDSINKENYIELSNGYKIPPISYGTGVIKKYSRNKFQYIKANIRPLLSTIKHMKLSKVWVMDFKGEEIIKEAYDVGFRMFDSGRIYGHSELVIGNALKNIDRDGYFLTTKISDMDIERELSPNTVKENFDNSLKYLNTDHADLYLLHWPYGNWIDIYKGIEEEYKKGRTKAIGVCNFKVENFEKLAKECEITPHVCQTELHPLNSKKDIREYCKKHNIVLMAHTPTGHMIEQIKTNKTLNELAKKYDKSLAQIILRWHIQNGVIPVVWTTDKEHMKQNLDIFDFSLSKEDMEKIESLDEGFVVLNSDGIDDPKYIYNL